MSESCTASFVPSTARGARTCTSFPPTQGGDLHQIFGLVQTLHPRGAAKWLQRVTGRGLRTVKYWLAGQYQPRSSELLKITTALRAELDAQRKAVEQFELTF